MSTGVWHYQEAERLLAAVPRVEGMVADGVIEGEDAIRTVELAVARAQVHATLALAAATALGLVEGGDIPGMRMGDVEAWERACSVVPQLDEAAP